jgi:hypothetical protein
MILPGMILPLLRRGCVCLAFTLSALLSLAWSPTGHMVIGEIAKERLTPQVRGRTDKLVAAHLHPKLGGAIVGAIL